MPRVAITSKQRAANQDADRNSAIRRLIITKIALEGVQKRTLCDALDVTLPTLNKKIAQPGLLTVLELEALMRELRFTDTERKGLFA